MRLFVPFSHDTLHVGAQKQVLHAYLYLFDVLHLDDMADVGGGKPVNLPDLFHGVITPVVHKVGSAEFVQMGLGVIGAAVFSFGRYPVPRPSSRGKRAARSAAPKERINRIAVVSCFGPFLSQYRRLWTGRSAHGGGICRLPHARLAVSPAVMDCFLFIN